MTTMAHLDLKRHLWMAESDPVKRARLAVEYGDAIRAAPKPEQVPQPEKRMVQKRKPPKTDGRPSGFVKKRLPQAGRVTRRVTRTKKVFRKHRAAIVRYQ
jgi:hypothetical protein